MFSHSLIKDQLKLKRGKGTMSHYHYHAASIPKNLYEAFLRTDGVNVEVALIPFTVRAGRVRSTGVTAVIAGAIGAAGRQRRQSRSGGAAAHARSATRLGAAAALVRGQERRHGSGFVFVFHCHEILLDSFEERSLFSLHIVTWNVAWRRQL